MVTLSITDYSLKPEFQYCAFCKYYNIPVPSLASPNRGFGLGLCTLPPASPPQTTYLCKPSCKQFKFAFHPLYGFSKDEFDWYKYKMCERLKSINVVFATQLKNDYRKNK